MIAPLFFLIATFLDYGFASVNTLYYQHADINRFYTVEYINVSDMCYGGLEQEWEGKRYVYVAGGIPVDIVRELYKQRSDGTFSKIYEDGGPIFIEEKDDSLSYRTVMLPYILPVGNYYWTLFYSKFYLPGGVVRTDVPPTNTNTFSVTICKDL